MYLCGVEFKIKNSKQMKKTTIILILLALITSSCKQATNKQETIAATVEMSETVEAVGMSATIEIKKLQKKGGIYYLNNEPFTGKAKKETMGEYSGTSEEWEMQNGKYHGKYGYFSEEYTTTGTYKEGKKHGEWMEMWVFESAKNFQYYKEGKKHGEWQYFNDDELYKTETYKDGVKIKEWTPKITMPAQTYVGTWCSQSDCSEYVTIWNIFDTDDYQEVDFSWYILRLISVQAHGFIEGNKIKFHTREENISGTMTFSPNGVMLSIEQSDFPNINPGSTYKYTFKKQE